LLLLLLLSLHLLVSLLPLVSLQLLAWLLLLLLLPLLPWWHPQALQVPRRGPPHACPGLWGCPQP
jgi:hypothetical protein